MIWSRLKKSILSTAVMCTSYKLQEWCTICTLTLLWFSYWQCRVMAERWTYPAATILGWFWFSDLQSDIMDNSRYRWYDRSDLEPSLHDRIFCVPTGCYHAMWRCKCQDRGYRSSCEWGRIPDDICGPITQPGTTWKIFLGPITQTWTWAKMKSGLITPPWTGYRSYWEREKSCISD